MIARRERITGILMKIIAKSGDLIGNQ